MIRHFLLALGTLPLLSAAEDMAWINADPAHAPTLAAAATALGLAPQAAKDASRPTRVLLYQAEQQGMAMTQAAVAALAEHVRQGGALLITLGERPGTNAYALTPLAPTSAWQTLIPGASRGVGAVAMESGAADAEFFPEVPVLCLEHAWRLKPLHAAERGETRYERFARTQFYVDRQEQAGEPFLSRPLLDRDWRVRLRSADDRGDGLLITGRYGAGRVAVYAAQAATGDPALWTATLRWLATAPPALPAAAPAPTAESLAATVTVDRAARVLRVRASNPGAAALRLPVVARLSTSDGALLGDATAQLDLPAHGGGEATLALPANDDLAPQALTARDAFAVRLGVLAQDGATVCWETRLEADLTPPVTVQVALDELRRAPRDFHAPGPETLKLPDRGGLEVAAYAAAPGQELHALVTVANGARDLALTARVADGRHDPSAQALNDGAASQAKPSDGHSGWGQWQGVEKEEQTLVFRLAAPSTITQVELIGAVAEAGKGTSNPGAVEISVDGKAVATCDDLDQRFAGSGRALIDLPAGTSGAEVRLRLPWSATTPTLEKRRALRLGEVGLWGCAGPAPAARQVEVRLRLVGPGGAARDLGARTLEVAGGGRASVSVAFTPEAPAAGGFGAWRVEAASADAPPASAPLLVIAPAHALAPVGDLQDAGHTAEFGAIVTRGVRTYLELGTGSRETGEGWGQPEDLVYCYAHGLKQVGANARTQPGRLYLSENDFRHYANPWTCYPDGELFFSLAAPSLVARNRTSKAWQDATAVRIFHSDRWDTGPSVNSMFTWPELVEFDRWLGTQKLPRLSGRTRQALCREIVEQHLGQLRAWQLGRYGAAIAALHDAVAGAGKRLVVSGQGVPLVPLRALEPLAATIQGMSDDNTWGGMEEDLAMTAGRQMALKALNPSWRMNSNLVWGYDTCVFDDPHWHVPVGVTETSRRHLATRAWRGSVGADGAYRSMHTFGYGMNAGISLLATANDWQQGWNAAERESLIAPDGPIGLGVAVSTALLDDPQRPDFSGGGMGGSAADAYVDGVARVIGRLHHAQVSVPFAANVASLSRWTGSAPLICLDIAAWLPSERAALSAWARQEVPLICFAGSAPLPDELAALFSAAPAATERIGAAAVRVTGNRVLIEGGYAQLDGPAALRLAALLQRLALLPITYPPGTAGYGFTCGGQRCVTIEDWAEAPRRVELRLRAAGAGTRASATGLNEHRAYAVRRDGRDWVITVPLRAGDGELIAVEEQP